MEDTLAGVHAAPRRPPGRLSAERPQETANSGRWRRAALVAAFALVSAGAAFAAWLAGLF
jgi:hypothetical protein